ncbi:MAG: helix-turn-helix transcriptional regulator [Bacteroidetes bacterium]|nr:helix-turn-helix transcriptional regulator [Bacteroidota bacterium]
MLGLKLKELREAQGLVQRKVAAELHVDTAYVSKVERDEKPVSRNHLKKLAELLSYPEEELLTLWIADKLYDMVKQEAVGLKSIEVVQAILKMKLDNGQSNQPV